MPTNYAAVRPELHNPNPSPNHSTHMWSFELEFGTPVRPTTALRYVHTKLGSQSHFIFKL